MFCIEKKSKVVFVPIEIFVFYNLNFISTAPGSSLKMARELVMIKITTAEWRECSRTLQKFKVDSAESILNNI